MNDQDRIAIEAKLAKQKALQEKCFARLDEYSKLPGISRLVELDKERSLIESLVEYRNEMKLLDMDATKVFQDWRHEHMKPKD
jgi:hypothetical protein